MVGTLVAERYQVIRSIGSGGMAEVYLARDAASGREVALKILHLRHAENAEYVERFLREARAAASLDHANIVPVHDWGSVDGAYFMALEYVPGQTLKQLIDERGPLPQDDALGIAVHLAAALDYAHRHGVTHRDVKPQNVIVDGEGRPRLTDFGIARVEGSDGLTQTRSVLGTAHYLSPEQARGERVDHRSDLYSLGVALYEMLTGRVPFDGDTAVAVAMKHVSEQPTLPRELNPGISPDAEAVVLKLMAKAPDRRYQTGGELRADIEAVREGRVAGAMMGATIAIGAADTRAQTKAGAVAAERPRGLEARFVGLAPVAGLAADIGRKARASGSAMREAGARSGGRLRALALVATLLLVLAAVVLWGQASTMGVEAADVTGASPSEAAARLADLGLQLQVVGGILSPDVPRGLIVSQRPEARQRIERGGVVQVAVSLGPGVAVPDLTGRSEADARTRLRGAGLVLGTVARAAGDQAPAGRVLAQDPAPGTVVTGDSPVNVVLGAEPPPRQEQNQGPGRGRQGRGRRD